jgi:hypothetical protein
VAKAEILAAIIESSMPNIVEADINIVEEKINILEPEAELPGQKSPIKMDTYKSIRSQVTINTIDGKEFSGQIAQEDPDWITIYYAQKLAFIAQSAIASIIATPTPTDTRWLAGAKSLPQTPLR